MSAGAPAPDFFLASTESFELAPPRRCYRVRRVPGRAADDYLVIRIDPLLKGQPFGLGERDLDEVVIATRHVRRTLFPVSEWPMSVHVARMLRDAQEQPSLQRSDLASIGWAELYQTESDARRAVERPPVSSD